MKKLKVPGGNISLKTKKNEDPAIMEWLNAQSNLMDSIRYLIENEVRLHGVRNLQTFVPAERSFQLTGSPAESAHEAAGVAPAAMPMVHNRELAASAETAPPAEAAASGGIEVANATDAADALRPQGRTAAAAAERQEGQAAAAGAGTEAGTGSGAGEAQSPPPSPVASGAVPAGTAATVPVHSQQAEGAGSELGADEDWDIIDDDIDDDDIESWT